MQGKHHLDAESGLKFEDDMYRFVFSALALPRKDPLKDPIEEWGR